MTHPFWQFSLRVYSQPGIKSLCLKLQDSREVDVNVLLFACWLGTCSRALAPDVITGDRLFNDCRQHVILPLRKLRRELAGIAPLKSVYQATLEAEIAAEALAQRLLYEKRDNHLCCDLAKTRLVFDNVGCYLRSVNTETLLPGDMDLLLNACLPDMQG